MAKQKNAVEQLNAIAGTHDQTYAMALEVLERLSILRLVYRAIDSVEGILPNNKEFSAARDQLRRLLGEINGLNNRADLLSGLLFRCMGKRATAQDPELPAGPSKVKPRRLS